MKLIKKIKNDVNNKTDGKELEDMNKCRDI